MCDIDIPFGSEHSMTSRNKIRECKSPWHSLFVRTWDFNLGAYSLYLCFCVVCVSVCLSVYLSQLKIKPRAFHILIKCSTTEVHPEPLEPLY